MGYVPNRDTMFLRIKSTAELAMDSSTLNLLRCFIGEALESGIWEEYPEEQKLMWDLHDAILVNRVVDDSHKISSAGHWTWRRENDEKDARRNAKALLDEVLGEGQAEASKRFLSEPEDIIRWETDGGKPADGVDKPEEAV